MRLTTTIGIMSLLMTALLSGCGSGPIKPVDKIAMAESLINSAKEADAAQYAQLELHLAEENLEKAKQKMAEKEYEQARMLAERAIVDAQYAEKAAHAKQAASTKEQVQEGVETLQRELNRK